MGRFQGRGFWRGGHWHTEEHIEGFFFGGGEGGGGEGKIKREKRGFQIPPNCGSNKVFRGFNT